ncbi:DNA mismatch repair protein Mlh1, putative [Talaromyces stipitatus ATCC 10500]|uniref:DNA mismatch repair protein Mlh1, putative n=1 Tax=Talaromyces stipitatus (strain ATCC 10500 / CBS 375.48 / QM 6759 / NRRL 1006) TaxID=441959 RepID=B8LY27_TALSN|nr:DNA mismatch repair protein Mlh1, putative [Talaromyces stipitatus ATCC 10500]EED23272.1 DNA mismatch repair protein Mlh1, putative [Talaromyces stipitatus ATCC 10500]
MDDTMDIETTEPRGTKRTADDAGLPSNEQRRIRALDPDVVNKIAAGEIIVAPMHALKELIENSVDAGSTSIEILVKDGGLKLLQITDNGHGINVDDLPILCERFTTSKLREFEDLTAIGTYGFRGEALASISHISHLTVTTKTASSSCAWRAHYSDGKLVPAKPSQSAKPKPTAGRGGTQITVEDLFYNVPTRRRAFRSSSEEYAKILDVVGRYAVHCSNVAFSCKKHGDSGSSIATTAKSSTIDRIRQIHGSSVANELIDFNIEDTKRLGFKASGLVTNANYHVKRTTILLFINHRSVESSALKKAIEQTYSTFLPKGGHPFIYLDLEIEPNRVDVNVHPTKREVNFLNEDEIIESICSEITTRLAQVDSSRTFMTQTLLPGVPKESDIPPSDSATRRTSSQKPYENNLVRTDSRVRKITSMLPSLAAVSSTQLDSTNQTEDIERTNDGLHYETTDRDPLRIGLTSVKRLRATVRSEMHNGLTELFSTHTYVGLVDERRRIVAVQSGVKLYLVDYGMICNEFFYQIGLTDFGNFGVIKLDPPPKLIDLMQLGAEIERSEHYTTNHPSTVEGGTTQSSSQNDEMEEIFQKAPEIVSQTLIDRRDMLDEYFSMKISDEGELLTIPLLLRGYVPSLAKLPRFLLRLGPYVNWTSEGECFRTFLRELAAFYTPEQLPPPPSQPRKPEIASSQEGEDETATPTSQEQSQGRETREEDSITTRRSQLIRMLEHVLFPSIRARMVATNALLGGVVEVADLKGLYRVFERC